MKKVSVIVPAYNVEKYIDRCVESLLKQTLEDIEFIIINDGSTDNTLKKISKYLSNDKIRLYDRSNHGIGSTRNYGLNLAHGEYIGFVDSDDYIEPDMFEKLYNKAKQDNLDMVICDYYKNFEETNKSVIDIIGDMDVKKIYNLKDNSYLFNQINLSPWNKLYKKDLINLSIENFSETLKYEDVPFVVRMLVTSSSIGKVNTPLYHYVIHKNSETTVMNEKVFDLFEIFDILLREHSNKEYIKDELNYLIVQRLSDYNIQQRNQKNRKIRNKFIDESFLYLEKNIPNYKNNIYYKKISVFKRIIEKNKCITKIYCSLYVLAHKK